ncbi:hypothetical protein AB1Y20_008920 [Prymnesium parvum]|uniref:Uncharacterized protein n=1 Tax=Prymnesium parvum TaxID=97485 RepID=A0AB34K358_PRYPA
MPLSLALLPAASVLGAAHLPPLEPEQIAEHAAVDALALLLAAAALLTGGLAALARLSPSFDAALHVPLRSPLRRRRRSGAPPLPVRARVAYGELLRSFASVDDPIARAARAKRRVEALPAVREEAEGGRAAGGREHGQCESCSASYAAHIPALLKRCRGSCCTGQPHVAVATLVPYSVLCEWSRGKVPSLRP